MHIIPVIDLKDGLVVSALQGQREAYQPLLSPLCSTSKLEDCISGFLTVYTFKTIYIADLNAIDTFGGDNPSTERVAVYVGDAMATQITGRVRVQSVIITEAPNCKATYTL